MPLCGLGTSPKQKSVNPVMGDNFALIRVGLFWSVPDMQVTPWQHLLVLEGRCEDPRIV